MRRLHKFVLAVAPLLAASAFAESANAAWFYQGTVQGVPTYLDTNTGLVWTRTLGRVRSSDWGNEAKLRVNQLGFHLPSFQQLQAMYNFSGGGGQLGIRNGLLDYYETSNPNVLGNAFGNGFQTPQQRKGVGDNWFIGVK